MLPTHPLPLRNIKMVPKYNYQQFFMEYFLLILGQLMRFGRSVMNQNDMFMRALRQPGSSDMFMRALRSPDMFMRALRSSDMFMRALR